MDGFTEAVMWANGRPDLLGEVRPLIRSGQPIDRQRRVDAADNLVEAQFGHTVDRSARYLKSGQSERFAIPLLALLVRPALERERGAQPPFQECAQTA